MSSKTAITLSEVSLDYPVTNKGIGLLRELLTRRVKWSKSSFFRALENVSIEIKKGEVIGIMGANGSGKSTLLRVIAGIYAPDEGSVNVQGRITLLAGIGTGFQQDLTGRENIYLTGSIYGYSKREISDLENEIIEFSGIHDFIDRPIRTYSAGMRARLGFAIVSNLEPDILLLDEVMSVGDAEFRKKSRKKIEELINGEATVIIVSHSKSIIKGICDRIFAIDKGRIVTDGKIESAFEFYDSVGK
jgi:ABC-type polysaccharide/polyol phosphate transport system ATPase subunit